MTFYIGNDPDPGKCPACARENANEIVQDGVVVLYACICGHTWLPPAIETRRLTFSYSVLPPSPVIPPSITLPPGGYPQIKPRWFTFSFPHCADEQIAPKYDKSHWFKNVEEG